MSVEGTLEVPGYLDGHRRDEGGVGRNQLLVKQRQHQVGEPNWVIWVLCRVVLGEGGVVLVEQFGGKLIEGDFPGLRSSRVHKCRKGLALLQIDEFVFLVSYVVLVCSLDKLLDMVREAPHLPLYQPLHYHTQQFQLALVLPPHAPPHLTEEPSHLTLWHSFKRTRLDDALDCCHVERTSSKLAFSLHSPPIVQQSIPIDSVLGGLVEQSAAHQPHLAQLSTDSPRPLLPDCQ